MKPLLHARSSVKKYGGTVDDYIGIHDFMDSTKSALPDVRHRAILHSAFGIFLVEKVFGKYFTNSELKQVSIRDVAEDHVMEDLGFIPTMEQWLKNIPLQDWMNGRRTKRVVKHIPMDISFWEDRMKFQLDDDDDALEPFKELLETEQRRKKYYD